jgi:hypothetical protein
VSPTSASPSAAALTRNGSAVVTIGAGRHGAGRDNRVSPRLYPARYTATRVEPRATLEQAEELRRVLEELGEQLSE